MTITAHWQDKSGEWREFEQPPAFLPQPTSAVIAMFEGRKIPVVMEIDGGYICTKNVFNEVKRNHAKVMTFASIKPSEMPFQEFLRG